MPPSTKGKKPPSTEASPKLFECEICPFAAKTTGNLKTHHTRKHTERDGGLECKQCAKKCKTKFDLDQHQQNDCNKMGGQCQKCKTVFTTKGTLQRHMRDNIENPNCGAETKKCQHAKKEKKTPVAIGLRVRPENGEQIDEMLDNIDVNIVKQFLEEVEVWQTYELQLIISQNKCQGISESDDFFNKVEKQICSLAAMKLSPYYKVLEEEALIWEENLNQIHDLFGLWKDVQGLWEKLRGIFSGSADIKALLPVQTSLYKNINSDFLKLMKKVKQSPIVLDVLNINGAQSTLEHLADRLGIIQKALGEYLERQRASFPRFYFVGDEDLLEIIGNSKDIPRLQKHFKKMFAGVSSILLNEENIVLGIASCEGEQVVFNTPVSTIVHPNISDWLTQVEKEMRVTLAQQLADSVRDIQQFKEGVIDQPAFMKWCDEHPAQVVVLAAQIMWSEDVEAALQAVSPTSVNSLVLVQRVLNRVQLTVDVLTDSVLQEQPTLRRRKLEHLINELVHKRTVTQRLIDLRISDPTAFEWLCQMRFYFDPKQTDILKQLSIKMGHAKFHYGFEYLGVPNRLFQTQLTDRCYLAMTLALDSRLGGSLFGPAGTGKTESVKALGHQLGRFVYVFNCDDTFDFQAMGRIFVGLSQVGAWGCFDELNRLEERILSSISTQVQTIQEALKSQKENKKEGVVEVELVGKQVKVSQDTAIFITMNPGYAGRSNLPDNLKKLFRSLAMTTPERELIAEVILFSQGFRKAGKLAQKIVLFFKLCDEQLSNQSHYDFGLRALKSVLVSAGNVKRDRIQKIREDMQARGETFIDDESVIAENLPEQEILVQSFHETMAPKFVTEDIPLFHSALNVVFPGIAYTRAEMARLREQIRKVCHEDYLVCGENDEQGSMWMEKVLQLYQISQLNHGLMMVGPSGSGKSSAWRVLFKSLDRLEGTSSVFLVIDPKVISKEALYGVLDPNTRQWTDGVLTGILRQFIDNVPGEINKRKWIIFDGDVDPEWVENLNSVLDDNKLLTLPNGERLSIPPNVRIMFEVQDLKYATLATVSRCGMVYFSEDVLTSEIIFEHYLARLRHVPLEDVKKDVVRTPSGKPDKKKMEEIISPAIQVQRRVADLLEPHFSPDGMVIRALEHAATQLEHIMDFTRFRALDTLFSMLNQSVRNILNYNHTQKDPMHSVQLERYIPKALVYAILWSFAGDGKLKARNDLGEFLRGLTTIPLPPPDMSIIDYEVSIGGEWISWSSKVPQIELDFKDKEVIPDNIVVPTLDTVRLKSLLYTWLADHKPLILCGPPGSCKTMTLFSALRALPDMEVVGLNFSSATSPELLLKTLEHHCEYRKTPNGMILSPVQLGKWLVLFCDEINLPDMDKYGTQRVISFLRQMVEQGGFWRPTPGGSGGEQSWVRMERIQFVGACNPPTDPGRKTLTHRFLRHAPVVYVDYPGKTSLKQIYGTFNRAMLRQDDARVRSLHTFADPLTNAMVEFYLLSQDHFTQDMQPHYVYSPRELTRWVRGIFEAIRLSETLSVEGLVRLWAHEALRLFQDRLVDDEERKWTNKNIDRVGLKYFPNINREKALARPILLSRLKDAKALIPVDREELRSYLKTVLEKFCKEELDVQLVLFDEVLDHVLRIDRIFRQPQGHLLLIGVSGSGKTTLSHFVAWMNGLSVFQVKVHNKYTAAHFDKDLREVLKRAGCKDEKICFMLDESNVLDSAFVERVNTLLTNGEVPGLFEGDEYTTLMTECKEGAQREGHMLDSDEEHYKWLTKQVQRNLHVVFTMNPSSEGLKDRASTSPALFNRCVLNWFGDWSDSAFFQVGKELTDRMDLERPNWIASKNFPSAFPALRLPPSHRDAVINATVYVHQTLHHACARLVKRGGRSTAITPRHYLDFINQFVNLYNEKRSELEKQQEQLNVGINKIDETVEQVKEMKNLLAAKSQELQTKNEAANSKLRQMVKDQNEAEQKKIQSQEIQAMIEKQTHEIAIKKKDVMADLDQVEPAVIEAQQAVKGIKKQHLAELKSLNKPPAPVKLALEAICLLLGKATSDWVEIKKIITHMNFIPTIVNFCTEDISDSVRDQMINKYLNNPDYNFDKVNRASVACGPLVKWATAQVNYADMLKRVEPLRNELKSLEKQADVNKKRGEETTTLIATLEHSIASYKEEYDLLTSQAQAIKTDLETVQRKVERSVGLSRSLAIEKKRLEASSEKLQTQMSTIVGDTLLSSAFLAYAGYFDEQYRHSLFTRWCSHLQAANIQYRSDIARTEYLSNPDERLRWQANALPADDLCTENAIMLRRFNRYPLIIDPSGQATEFIMNEFKDRNITRTSFLDDAFQENLKLAMRWGNPLLVENAECYDPVLNPLLNRGHQKSNGRIPLGKKDINLSPSGGQAPAIIPLGNENIGVLPTFTIFLSTRDPSVEFPPDICSRVTFVNFTVTRSSLQSQCLNLVLKAERPDIDEKRSDLLKLQGKYQSRLREKQDNLLKKLNEAKGKILDDDNVITALKKLEQTASTIQKKEKNKNKVIGEIETVSQQYMPLAQACSNIYFTLNSLNQVHFLYQYSLHFFLDIFHSVLYNNARLKEVSDYGQRLSIVTSDLFQVVYCRVARGMLHIDRLTFAVLLCRIHLRGLNGEPKLDAEFQHFLRGKDGLINNTDLPELKNLGLSSDEIDALARLSMKFPAFKGLVKRINRSSKKFQQFLQHNTPEMCVPAIWAPDKSLSAISMAMMKLLVIQAVRPDRVIAAGHQLVDAVFGQSFIPAGEEELDLAKIVDTEVKGGTPVLLCSAPGFDASGRLDELATKQNKQITSIAIGSAEGFSQAEKAINSAVKTGRWVMLKNVHLAPQWLVKLEKKLHSLQPHANFRLFLTTEINPKIPVNLLRGCEVLVFEPPPGIRANLLRTYSSISKERMDKTPCKERSRLYFLLAWFHAVVQERLRYCPLGWTKYYEFNESDLKVACDTLDTWIDTMALGRTNLPPEKVPWNALSTLLSQCIYGSKIDNEFDQRTLETIVSKIFTPKSFEPVFLLVSSQEVESGDSYRIVMPEGIHRDQFLQWIEGLSDRQYPAWLGLPNNAEKVLLTTRGTDMATKLLKMQLLEDDDDDQNQRDKDNAAAQRNDGQPNWMRSLLESAQTWMGLLPDSLVTLRSTVENIEDPLYLFFEREVNSGSKLLHDVRQDLNDVVLICKGEKKQTNYHRQMLSDLVKGILPRSWRRYTIPDSTTVIQWITDFSLRVKQLQQVSQVVSQGGARELQTVTVWLGGLFNPEAYVTATRQCVARANKWPLEELTLKVTIEDQPTSTYEDRCFSLKGLKLQGAVSEGNKLRLTSAMMTDLSLTRLRWNHVERAQQVEAGTVTLPVYLNANRTEILFTVDISVDNPEKKLSFYERGVALFATFLF